MGGFSSIYIGMSGLDANGQWLTSIGNNVANMNTVAFKSSHPTFADLVRGSLAGGGHGADGMGVAESAPRVNFAQGSLSQTSNPMDWAIDGKGFFVVKDSAGNSFYTRDGQFRLRVAQDQDQITDATGHVLQGYVADKNGVIGNTLGDVKLNAVMASKATTKMALALNLDSTSKVPATSFNPADATTYNYSVSQVVYDSRSGLDNVAHTLTAYFSKTGVGQWGVHVQVDGGVASDAGRLVFDTVGALTAGAKQTVSVAIPIPGKPPTTLSQSIDIDYTGTTQYGTASSVLAQSQDGYNQGRLDSVSLVGDGIISGTFSNQQHQAIAQVALASFNAPEGLAQLGKGLFAASRDSGAAATLKPGSAWVPGQASVGRVRANMLELSNVELTDNFVDMIAAQFGFQASSRAVTSSDDVVQTAIGLRR